MTVDVKAVKIDTVQVLNFNETDGLLVISLKAAPADPGYTNPLLVLIGNRLFGLSDLPFLSRTAVQIRLVAPLALLRAARFITVKRLFWGPDYADTVAFDLSTLIASHANIDFLPARVAITYQDDKKALLAITGSNLQGTQLLVPDQTESFQQVGSTLVVFSLKPDELKGLKQIVLKNSDDQTFILPVGDSGNSASDKNSQTPEKPTLRPTLEKHAPVKSGKGLKLAVKGRGLESIDAVSLDGKFLAVTLSQDKKSIVVTIPDEVATAPGEKVLHFTLKNGNVIRYRFAIVP